MNEQLMQELKAWKEAQAAGLTTVQKGQDLIQKRIDAIEAELSRGGNAYRDTAVKTLFEELSESPNFKEFTERGKGKLSFTVKRSMFPSELKTTITSAAVGNSTPGILTPERVQGIVKPGVSAFRVRELIPRFGTESNAIEFVKEDGFTNAASPVAETISKPESALQFTIDHKLVKTLAHTLPATRQVLSDFSQLRSYIDMRLLEGLKDVEDNELVSGDGTGQHLTGLMSQAGAYDTARTEAADTRIDILNHAISQIEDVNQRATGFILHPRDWRAIQRLKDNDGNYLIGAPQGSQLMPFLWGLPVATTTAMPRGFWIAADFTKTALFDRQEATVELSTEHADFFIKNMVMFLCEERLTFCVFRNDAVITGAF